MNPDGGGGGGGGGGDFGPRRQEAERWLGVAGKLLEARDFEGCKQFVEQSVSADPRVPGAEELVAAAEVLQSVEKRRINGHPDYYAVLGLDSSLPSSLEPAAVSLHYQRLSLLLHRDPSTPAFTDAARAVADAWAMLSDPPSKALFDKELEVAKPKPKPRPPSPSPPPPAPLAASPPRKTPVKPAKSPTVAKSPKSASLKGESSVKASKSVAKPTDFWTMCTTCCHVHQYGRLCEGQYLLCHSCRRPFFAAAMHEPPPIVPDSDMYYCTWGFFPLGFPGGPGYGGMYGLGSQFGAGAQPGEVPPKIGDENINGTGVGSGIGTLNIFPIKRGRGRPRKNPPSSGLHTPATPGAQPSVISLKLGQQSVSVTGTTAGTPNTFPGKRGRGRPRKNPPVLYGMPRSHPVKTPRTQPSVVQSKIQGESVNGTGTLNSFPVKRGRGRPRKNQPNPTITFAMPESGLIDVPVVESVSAVSMPSTGWGSSNVEGTSASTAVISLISGPVISPISRPVISPISGPVTSPVSGQVTSPVSGPVISPISGTVISPISGAVISPISGPVKRGRGRPRKNEADSMSQKKKMVAKKRVNANMEKVVVDMN